MVAANPLFRGSFTLRKFQATVINDIWPEVTFFTLIATMVVLVTEKTSHNLNINNGLLTVLGTVLGLVLSFRTSSAYERYQDGRKMWSNINIASRNFAQQVWIHVPVERKDGATPVQAVIEKKSMINLVLAFSISVKHFLRDEPGVYYEDLYPLISFLPRHTNSPSGKEDELLPLWHEVDDGHHHINDPVAQYNADTTSTGSTRRPSGSSSDPEKALPFNPMLKPARNPPPTSFFDFFPILKIFRWIEHVLTRKPRPKGRGKKRRLYEYVESHIPLEIVLVLSNYTAWLMRKGLLQPAIAASFTANLTSLSDTLSNLERICNTPLPFAYQAHLRMSLWLYLFFLPFQLEKAFGWVIIPGTAFAAFLLLGFLEIGQEIENPFNYDLNDLDLDYFCQNIQKELALITAHTTPDPHEFIFTNINKPFAPVDMRSAKDLAEDGPHYSRPDEPKEDSFASLRRTMVRHWSDVSRS
ncbi:Bestrophin, RFP-TM, chloride channel-domain-containing protein [Gymnopilus junonius]|uniref:Bestrophin, RFP-TM, chloride channel-domain-containing protein n=1 Tax=Gymnopilus junonius TaxID=109634 RepID=A0A9P5TSE2_GYMJU|nr:Bestrophin, RFP-TM, chloride channel-domain-containing protein [Gymnopilus junonius]